MFETLSYNKKRVLGLIILLVSAGTIGLLLFLLFTSAPLIEEPQDGIVTPDQTIPGGLMPSDPAGDRSSDQQTDSGISQFPSSVAQGGDTFTQQLTASQIIAPTLIDGSGIAYYDPSDGRFYQVDESGEIIALSLAQFPDAQTVVFSDSAQKAVLEFPDGSNILFDIENEQETILPAHWESFDFSTGGKQLASKSISSDPSQNALVVSSSDGSRTQTIAAIGNNADKVTLNWSSNNNLVGFSETGTTALGFGRYEIYLIGNDGEESGHLIVEGGNFSALWSPANSKILYSVANSSDQNRPSLWIADGSGNIGANRKNLHTPTWVEKCTFRTDTLLLCAVPDEAPAGSGMDARLVESSDTVYSINLNTGTKQVIGSPALDMQMFDLYVSDNGEVLYFLDSAGRLQFMRLK